MTASRIGRLLVAPAVLLLAPVAGAAAVTTTETAATPTASSSTAAAVTSSPTSTSTATPAPGVTATDARSATSTSTTTAALSLSTASSTSRSTTSAAPRPVAVASGVRSADPPVAAVDFAFRPGTVTVHVGDTITWTNSGKQPHTATANNGGFDTGILKAGQSASHTFASAGTFTYFCVVHPFMKGTVVVLAAAGGTKAPGSTSSGTPAAPASAGPTAGAPASSAAPTPSATASTAATTPTLPLTGMPVLAALSLGLVLFGLGVAGHLVLRRAGLHE